MRVSTLDQATANQERELHEIAGRLGYEITKVYRDHGISGSKGRNGRPQFDALCRDAAERQFDMVTAWSVDRLGRSLQDLVAFLSDCVKLNPRGRLCLEWQDLSESVEVCLRDHRHSLEQPEILRLARQARKGSS